MKSNDAEATLRKGSLPKSEAVRQSRSEEGAAKRCIDQQVDGNGDPKKRTRNYWGTSNKEEV